uniref:PAS domain-containing protein n=1 Tax=Alexandrium monilatum TaxID=311494 RepID=A0A7S4RDS8_9DINO
MAEANRDKTLQKAEERILRMRIADAFRTNVFLLFVLLALRFAPDMTALSGVPNFREVITMIMCVHAGSLAATGAATLSDDANVARNARLVMLAGLGQRLVGHALLIYSNGSGQWFLKTLGSLTPMSAAKVCDTPATFRAYMLLQNLLVLADSWRDHESGWAFVAISLYVGAHSHDVVRHYAAQAELRAQLLSANIERRIAEETTKNIFQRLCDAFVSLSADGRIAGPSPQLSALLGMTSNLQGRPFAGLLSSSEEKGVADFSGALAGEPGEIRHRQVKLADAYGQPVSVHIFHTTFGAQHEQPSTTALGIMETWAPKSSAGRSRRGEEEGQDAASSSRASAGAAGHGGEALQRPSRSRSRRSEREDRDGPLARLWRDVGRSLASPAPSHGREPSRPRSRQDEREDSSGTAERRRLAEASPSASRASSHSKNPSRARSRRGEREGSSGIVERPWLAETLPSASRASSRGAAAGATGHTPHQAAATGSGRGRPGTTPSPRASARQPRRREPQSTPSAD